MPDKKVCITGTTWDDFLERKTSRAFEKRGFFSQNTDDTA
jgi:hypothetical protein